MGNEWFSREISRENSDFPGKFLRKVDKWAVRPKILKVFEGVFTSFIRKCTKNTSRNDIFLFFFQWKYLLSQGDLFSGLGGKFTMTLTLEPVNPPSEPHFSKTHRSPMYRESPPQVSTGTKIHRVPVPGGRKPGGVRCPGACGALGERVLHSPILEHLP